MESGPSSTVPVGEDRNHSDHRDANIPGIDASVDPIDPEEPLRATGSRAADGRTTVPPQGIGATLRLAQPALFAGVPQKHRFCGEPQPDTEQCEWNRRKSRSD